MKLLFKKEGKVIGDEFGHQHEEMLFESNRGFVRCCRSCGAFELRFGNAIIGMRLEELRLLTDTVSRLESEFTDESRPANDHAVIWLGHDGSGFRFRREEIAELHRLLAGARLFAMMSVDPSDLDSPC
ncbi:MAG: hypothetical protein IBJ03_14025 [Gemmatimonadaceae bacterium]|nr:hypothetical protein [Gemmatimonadaceae bacterium]